MVLAGMLQVIRNCALVSGAMLQAAANPVSDVVAALRSKNYSEAITRADAALRAHPDDPRLWTLKGMAQSANDPAHPAAALPALERALKIAPDYLPALEAAAQAEYSAGDSHARGHLDRILLQRPDDPTANAMLAVLDFRAADYASAATRFKAAQPVIDNQPTALAQYAASLANSDQLAAAVPVFARLAELQPADPATTYNLALAEYRIHKPQDALAHLQPQLNGANPGEEALTLGAEINESLGQTQPGLDLLRRAILLYPKDTAAYLYLAHLSFAHSSVQVGIDVLNAGIRQIPDEARFYLARGILLSQLGKNDQAGSDFDKASALDPKISMARTARGIAQSQQHHSDEALGTFRAAVREHPEDALGQYLLAEALSNNNPAPDSPEGREELAAATQAAKLDPRMKAAHNLLSTIYLRDGEYAKAAEHSEAALRVDPNDQEAIYHLLLTARKGIHKEQLPELVKRLAAAKEAAPDAVESPHGYLVEAK